MLTLATRACAGTKKHVTGSVVHKQHPSVRNSDVVGTAPYNTPFPALISLIHINYSEGILMAVNWFKDADEALARAREQNKPLLVDFSAAPD